MIKYEPKTKYNFTINPTKIPKNFSLKKEIDNKKIAPNIEENLNYIKQKYNTKINSDIILRQFEIIVKNRNYKAFIVFIDGMVESDFINNYVLKPLMLKNLSNINCEKNEVKIIDKNELQNCIYNKLIPENNTSIKIKFSEIIESINSGDCALFIDKLDICFDIDVKGFKQRSIERPQNENIIKGSQEGFVENIRTNTSLLRRLTNNENLIIENIEIGNLSRTKCGLCYMKNIANEDLINEAKYRLNNLEIDSLTSTGQLEQLIQDDCLSGIPQILSTERPDKCVKAIMQGRAVIIVNGNPYVLIIPAVVNDFLVSPEDTNLKPLFANFLRMIRVFAFFLTLLLPGVYIAVTNFHQELLPTELMFSILASRENVPFPIIVELLTMEISFELIREGGLRSPSAIGSTLGIVGALILGDAAVSANIVSPFLIIIVAITGLASFTIPDFTFGFHLRVYRFGFTILGYIAGFLGIAIGIVLYMSLISSLKSFGIDYTTKISAETSDQISKYFIQPFWKQEFRSEFLAPKRKVAQEHFSRKWENQD